MKVAFMVSRVIRTGPNTNMMAVLAHLPTDSVTADVVVLDADSDRAMLEDLCAWGIATRIVTGGGVRAQRSALRELAQVEGYDLVVSCGIRADWFNVLSMPRRCRVVIKQEPAFTPFRGRLMTILVRVWHLLLIFRARRIISVSRHVHDSLPRVVRKRSVVIPNAVDLDRFRPPSPDERRAARAKLGVDDDREVLAFAGTLDGRKRPHLLASAVIRLRSSGRPVELVIAGDGPMRARLEALAESAGVSLIGFREDVRELLWAADAFALPSTHEGLPLAAMEALACRLPIVLSDIPPHRELLEGWSRAGEVVEPTDEDELGGAIARVLDRSGDEAPRRLAEERLSAPLMARRYAELFVTLD